MMKNTGQAKTRTGRVASPLPKSAEPTVELGTAQSHAPNKSAGPIDPRRVNVLKTVREKPASFGIAHFPF